MAGPGRFGAVITAMVTPFDDRFALDLDGAGALARWLVDHGSDALVVAGTTGEGTVLSNDEKAELWRVVAEAVTVPVIAGAGTNDTRHSVELTKLAEVAGAAGILAVTPYYNRPSQAGLAAHFRAVAGATSLPVFLYDIPFRTGRKVAHDTMLGLAREVPNILGVKDAAGDVAGSARLLAEAPRDFDLYSGEDPLNLALLALGASGVVSVVSHWAGPEIGEMIACLGRGDVEGARARNTELMTSYAFMSSDDAPNPLPAKAMMRRLGLAVGQCRLPMGPASPSLDERAADVLAGLRARPRAGRGAREPVG
ncbi:MAG TPA: 4-hydroxy-tetrahydrodipicolinate synthase [Acidimicrobiales bacterium]